ncbi:uncharacterized protein [Nicotiana sylvestris]|uniref:uncharacterized protein n=1 Tax=Nicotiana sylvestris TaxID=4096 RepID=UPI00388C7279
MYQVAKTLKLLKKNLKVLKSQYSHDIVREAEEDMKLLNKSRLKLQRDPSNKEVQQSSHLAEMYPQQRSKATWIKLGDDNTRYFYSIIKHRKLKQSTTQLKDDAGTWQTDPGAIANLFVDYYSEILGRKPTSRVLKAAVDHLVAENQSAFVQGRSMLHNVLICHDILRHYNWKTTPRCLMKIDLRKAYDMLKSMEKVMDILLGRDGLGRNESSVKRIVEAINYYSNVTGLKSNMDKSSIFIAGVDDNTKKKLLEITGFVLGTLPIRYLRLPLSPKKWNKIDCHMLVEKITQRIRVTYSRLLCRLQIINAVLFFIHSFWGTVFILPQSILKEVDRICREYLWDSSEEIKKLSLVSGKRSVILRS